MRAVTIITMITALAIAGTGALWLARAHWIHQRITMALHPSIDAAASAASAPCPPIGHRPTTIMLVGDSRISQWPADLLSPEVSNRGMAGETVAHLALRFEDVVLACRPRALLISSGMNDLVAASFLNPAEAQAVVAHVVESLVLLGSQAGAEGVQAYVGTIVPPGRPDPLRRLFWSWTLTNLVVQVNDRLRGHDWRGPVQLVDLAAAIDPEQAPILPERYRRDTLHLNRDGYLRLSLALPRLFSAVE